MINNPPASEGDMGSILGLGRSLGKGNDNPLQRSYPENPMNRGAQQGYGPEGCSWTGQKQIKKNVIRFWMYFKGIR